MTRSRVLAALSALLLATLAIAACTIVNGLTVPAKDAGSDASDAQADGARETGAGCARALPPPPPDASIEADDGGALDLLAAVRVIDFGADAGDAAFGFDLDNACTCFPDGPTCGLRPPPAETCDDPKGRDSQLQGAIGVVTSFGDVTAHVNAIVASGQGTVLLRVQNYNGLPDDPSVWVSFYSAPGNYGALPDGGVGMPATPKLDGTDTWALDDAAVDPSFVSNIAAQGYVSGGVVVVYAGIKIQLGATFGMKLFGAVATIDVDLSGPTPRLARSLVAGRWPVDDLYRAFGELPSTSGGVLCTGQGFSALAHQLICTGADISQNPAADGTTAPCDALSAAIKLTLVDAKFGPRVAVTPLPSPCPDVFTCP